MNFIAKNIDLLNKLNLSIEEMFVQIINMIIQAFHLIGGSFEGDTVASDNLI